MYAGGGALRLWPVFVLGRRFSGLVAIQPGHTLVTDGLYSRIRNPSYLGLLILSLGWALAFRSGAGVLLAALNIPPLIARMNSEERLLQRAIRPGIRGLPRPYVAAAAGSLLSRAFRKLHIWVVRRPLIRNSAYLINTTNILDFHLRSD